VLSHVKATSDSPSVLKPRPGLTTRNEAQALSPSITRTRKQLLAFEKQYGMTSDEFERRHVAAKISESLDFIEWLGEIQMPCQSRCEGRYPSQSDLVRGRDSTRLATLRSD
jgi:hypothetical protein